MKLRNLAMAGMLFAGSLQASILYNQSSGFGLGPGANSIFQDFSNPSPATAQQANIAVPNVTTGSRFSNLTVEANTNLYYDPNGAAGCGLGKGSVGSPTLPTLSACVGNYSLAALSGTPNQSNAQTTPGNDLSAVLPNLEIAFNSPVFATSFLFAAPSGPPLDLEVDIYNAAHVLIDTKQFKTVLASPSYLWIVENQQFTYVDLSEIAGSEPNTTFNALIGDVQASTVAPEPGTIGLLGLGLAGVGYFARRRKA